MILQSMPKQGIEPARSRNLTDFHIVIAYQQIVNHFGGYGGIRTHTCHTLNVMPLPIGLHIQSIKNSISAVHYVFNQTVLALNWLVWIIQYIRNLLESSFHLIEALVICNIIIIVHFKYLPSNLEIWIKQGIQSRNLAWKHLVLLVVCWNFLYVVHLSSPCINWLGILGSNQVHQSQSLRYKPLYQSPSINFQSIA